LERRHELLTDSYDYETVQLQNACTKLFGYHITLNRGGAENPNQFKLQSVYSNAHDPDDTFIFQVCDLHISISYLVQNLYSLRMLHTF